MIKLILKCALILMIGNAIGKVRKADKGKGQYETYEIKYKDHLYNKSLNGGR